MDGFISDAGLNGPGWRPIDLVCDRRTVIKGLLAATASAALAGCGNGGSGNSSGGTSLTKLRLAFCGQLLCVVPYEVTRARGHFAAQGLDVELVYTRGGNAAMQALVGGAVEYAGTSFDVALQAAANGAAIRRFASTGRLPMFALAVAPSRSRAIDSVARLAGATVAVSALGNADHALLMFLLDRAGVDPKSVSVAAIGINAFEALRQGQVDAAMVQEPALTLVVQAGGRELVNFMEIDEANRYLGGAYEFMGVSIRAADRERRLPEMRKLAAALAAGLADTRSIPADDIVAALPPPLVAGNDIAQLKQIISRYRLSLYPETVAIAVDAAERVRQSQEIAGLLQPDRVDLQQLLDTSALQG
jgi:NitT/TauT family transport system substrate-binding protein